MKQQSRKYWCCPAAVQNALRALGRKYVTQRNIANLCGTTPEGTDTADAMRGLAALGCTYEYYESDKHLPSFLWLRKAIRGGKPVVMAVDNSTHWVCCYGALGASFNVFDSSRWKHLSREHHVITLPTADLMARWKDRGRPSYVAISVDP